MPRKSFTPRTNHREAAPHRSSDGQRQDHPVGLQGGQHFRAELLPLAQGVRWPLQHDQAKCFKELERENARLRKLVADLSLEKAMLKEVASGNW